MKELGLFLVSLKVFFFQKETLYIFHTSVIRQDKHHVCFYFLLCVCSHRTALGSHLKAVFLSQDTRVHGFDDGVLIQSEVQRLGSAAGRQQGLMGVGLFEALHQTGPKKRERERCG